MVLYEGRHTFYRDPDASRPFVVDYVSVSAAAPTQMRVTVGTTLIEHVHVGPFSPHTWWGNNGLFERHEPLPGERFTIELGPAAILRLEGAHFAPVG